MSSPIVKEATSVDVGTSLRQLREAHNVSMRALAQLSGLSANALSMIERGKSSPSVSTLYRLAEALQVPVTAFFDHQAEHKNVVFIKSAERTRLSFMRGLWEGLGGEQFSGRVMPFLLTLENGASSGPNTMLHGGSEFAFCIRGQLEFQVENKVYLLETGDSLLFEANLNHRWRNPGGVVTNVLVVIFDGSEEDHSQLMLE